MRANKKIWVFKYGGTMQNTWIGKSLFVNGTLQVTNEKEANRLMQVPNMSWDFIEIDGVTGKPITKNDSKVAQEIIKKEAVVNADEEEVLSEMVDEVIQKEVETAEAKREKFEKMNFKELQKLAHETGFSDVFQISAYNAKKEQLVEYMIG